MTGPVTVISHATLFYYTITNRIIFSQGGPIMNISDWLDEKEAENVDVSQIDLPRNLAFDDDPDETIYFKDANPCGIFCTENHPFATVERFGHWYLSRGQDKQAGIHSDKMKWKLFTRDKEAALQTARTRIE
jgi:hypothetical protein